LLNIPENYHIYFVGGGASTQFFHIPANFLGKKAGYVDTGVWTKKAIKEAKLYGEVEVVASSADENYTTFQRALRFRQILTTSISAQTILFTVQSTKWIWTLQCRLLPI
jgi:phosphoserine aminotransferase